MDSAGEAGLTDWARLLHMTDDEIDAAIASDPDSFGLGEASRAKHRRAIHYQLYCEGPFWRWRLCARNGEVLAYSADSFPDENAAKQAIRRMYRAMAELGSAYY